MILMDRKSLSSAQKVEKQLGRRIRELRMERGLTQEKLAEEADLHATYLGLIEIGKKLPSLPATIKIADALKIPLFHLFMFETALPAKDKAIQELFDFLKTAKEGEAKFLLAVAKEYRKACS